LINYRLHNVKSCAESTFKICRKSNLLST